MKFDRIKLKIIEMINDSYELDNDSDFKNDLMCLASEGLKHKEIIRFKRLSTEVDRWKTIVLVEIEANNEKVLKVELKNTISWLASVKESLLRAESTDLYLFLAFNTKVSIEECLRIESTEQFCRKYVLLPDEEITEFLNRTFLQRLVNSKDTIDGKDPLERAFSETEAKHSWLTPEIQKKWKDAFANLTGSELAEVLLEEDLT